MALTSNSLTNRLVEFSGYLSFRKSKTSSPSLQSKDFMHFWALGMDTLVDPDAYQGLAEEVVSLLYVKDGLLHCNDEDRLVALSKQVNLLRKLKGTCLG